jgi:hypothetical protein
MEAVPPIDLLPFLICPSAIGDPHFINPDPGYLGDLCSDLRL